jgi:hypothetical protein
MAEKTTKLSIIVRTVDQATAKIRAINARLDAITKPFRDFKKALGDFKEKSGLSAVADGFRGIGSAVTSVISKIAVIGGVAVAVGYGVMSLIDKFDELGDKAERIGVSVDFLAQMRYAAERSGASVEELDQGLQSFTTNLGQARAGTGRMAAFLKLVSPELLKQLKAAKGNAEAFDLLASAMAKLKDPAKRAALAQKTIGDAALAPLLSRGAVGVKELRDRYLELAGSQEDAAKKAGIVDDSMKDLHASMDGVKAAIVSGLAPGIKIIVDRLKDWFVAHRGDIAEFAQRVGENLPAAFEAVGKAIMKVVHLLEKAYEVAQKLVDTVKYVVDLPGKLTGDVKLSPEYMKAIDDFKRQRAQQLATPSALDLLSAKFTPRRPPGALDAAIGRLQREGAVAPDAVSSADVPSKAAQALVASHARGAKTLADALKMHAEAGGAPAPKGEAKVTIDIKGAPKGTRATVDRGSTADVDLSVGYQMGAP